MSSSFSTDGIRTRLTAAFMVLPRDAPTAYEEIARRLGDRRVRLSVDDEVFDVVCERRRLIVEDRTGVVSVVIETSAAVVRDVLAGRSTMREALHDDTLRARGALGDLVAVLGALEAFVHGAVRSPALAELFADFQTERVA